MGEIFHALEVLNRTMRLGLSHHDVLRAEMGFKSALAMQGNPDPTLPTDPVALAEGYELVATLKPRAEAVSLGQLSTLARKELARPRTKVPAATFKQIDKAITAAATKAPQKATGGTAPAAPAKAAKATTAKAATAKSAVKTAAKKTTKRAK